MEFHVQTSSSLELKDITHQVKRLVKESGVKEGQVLIYVPHATAAITINENADPNIRTDIIEALGSMVKDSGWRHDRIDNNGSAHIRASVIGPSETVPLVDGEMQLGTWQDIFLVELDGPRDRRVVVSVVGR